MRRRFTSPSGRLDIDALDKSIVDARAKAAVEAGTTPSTLVPWNVHDLRRTVATGLQRLGVRLEVTEAVLNHISGSRAGIAGVYQRHDWEAEKRGALDAWVSATWWPRATDFDLRKLGENASRHSFDLNARTTVDALKIFETALRSTLSQITDQGLRVLIVLQTPILLSSWEGPTLDAPDCLFRKNDADCSMPLLLHDQLSNPVNNIIKKVATEFSSVQVFDPIPILCREERCSARVDGIIAYTDSLHLSATMSVALTEALTPYLDWLLPKQPTFEQKKDLVSHQ
jgi:hypothetical protein